MNNQEIINKALEILSSNITSGNALETPTAVKQYLTIKLAQQEREVFAVLFLNNAHQVIEYTELFYGTINSASVYPREVVKAGLKLNAAAAILAHNHPSGIAEPSQADRNITDTLVDICSVVDIRIIDHIVIGGNNAISFAERGLL